jgi:hypothetical protein
MAQIYTGIDPGNDGLTDLNVLFNLKGIQPVVFHTMKNQALDVYNRGFPRALSGGTAVQQNADSTLVQTPVNVYLGNQSSNATLYTVTTGKTFFCTGYIFLDRSGALNNAVLKVAGTGISEFDFNNQLGGGFQMVLTSGGGPPLFTATTAQAITATTTGNFSVTMWGWEE